MISVQQRQCLCPTDRKLDDRKRRQIRLGRRRGKNLAAVFPQQQGGRIHSTRPQRGRLAARGLPAFTAVTLHGPGVQQRAGVVGHRDNRRGRRRRGILAGRGCLQQGCFSQRRAGASGLGGCGKEGAVPHKGVAAALSVGGRPATRSTRSMHTKMLRSEPRQRSVPSGVQYRVAIDHFLVDTLNSLASYPHGTGHTCITFPPRPGQRQFDTRLAPAGGAVWPRPGTRAVTGASRMPQGYHECVTSLCQDLSDA